MHSREALVTWCAQASKCGAAAFLTLCGAAGCLPDFESLSGGIAAGAGGNAGNAGSAGTAGNGGSAGTAGSAGTGGSGGTAGTGGSAGSGGSAGNPALLPDGGLANLILNADFEESANRWAQVGNCALRIVTEPPAQSGSRSLEISGRTFQWEGPGYSVLNLVEDNAVYDVGAWVKVAEGEIPLQLTYKRRCDGDPVDGQFIPVGGPIFANEEWQHLQGTFTAPDCGPVESVLFVEVPYANRNDANAHVTFYIDNTLLMLQGP